MDYDPWEIEGIFHFDIIEVAYHRSMHRNISMLSPSGQCLDTFQPHVYCGVFCLCCFWFHVVSDANYMGLKFEI